MSDVLPAALLSKVSDLVAEQMALYFPPDRWPDLERGLRSAARKSEGKSVLDFVQGLLAAPLTQTEIDVLAGELTIGETYFFREKRCLDILTDKMLPAIMRARQDGDKRLRIWSAGCCTGEEVYTLAILLDKVLPELKGWQVSIMGTDINPLFLKKAATGIYSEWSFRDAPPWLKTEYFTDLGRHRFEVIARIKEKVSFSCLNLAEDLYPSLTNNTTAIDVIFCRNVLMYFHADRIKRIARNFHHALVDQGWFVVSLTETSTELYNVFNPVNFDGAVVYQKSDRKEEKDPADSWLEEEPTVASLEALFQAPGTSFPLLPPVMEAELGSLTSLEEATSLFSQGDDAGAEDALKSSPDDVTSLALRARIHANLGELAEARSWAEKALQVDKMNAGLHYLRAVILQEQGELGEATAALKRSLYLDSNFVMAYYALGNLALRSKGFSEVDKYFTNVLGLLTTYQSNDVLPQSDGLAAGRLKEMVESARLMNRAA